MRRRSSKPSRTLKTRIDSNRRKLNLLERLINKKQKNKHKDLVRRKAICLALAKGEFDDETRELLSRARNVKSAVKIEEWMQDFIAYSKKQNKRG